MVKRLSFLCVCLLLSRAAAAGPIVTWEAIGEITAARYGGFQNSPLVPPIGTPYELTVSFDPSSMIPTALSPAGSNCYTVSVSGSLNLGGFSYGLGGLGFTHGRLPGTTCEPGSISTDFHLSTTDDPPDSPWPALNSSFLEVFHFDAVQDAFPATPTRIFPGMMQIRDSSELVSVVGPVNFEAAGVEQPAPVPEPGTWTLFGLGLAAVARRVRRARAH